MKQPADNHLQLQALVKKYLESRYIMQLATVNDGNPWICTVHYASDDGFNIYWASSPDRRHSLDIAKSSKVAVAVVVKGPEHPVIGIQMEGEAGFVRERSEIERAIKLYDDKHHVSKEFYQGTIHGTAPFKLYKFVPKKGVIFSETDFPDNPRQTWLGEEKT